MDPMNPLSQPTDLVDIQLTIPEVDLGPTSRPDNGQWKQLVDHCMELYDTFDKSEYRKAKREEIKQARLAYEQKPAPDRNDWPWPDAYNIVMPLLAIAVDNLEPRLVAGLVGKDPVVRFELGDKAVQGITPVALKLLEDWYNNELRGPVRIEQVGMSLVHTLLLEGTWFSMPRYRQDKIKRKDWVFNPQQPLMPVVGPQGPLTQEIEEVVAEGGVIESIPFEDMLCADDLGTIDDWENGDKIRIVRPTYGELMNSRKALGYLPDMIGPWLVSEKSDRKVQQDDLTAVQEIAQASVTGNETIKCGEFHITYYTRKDEEAEEVEQKDFTQERLIVLIALESRTILRIMKLRDVNWRNESIIKRIRLFPEEGRSFGSSFYAKIKGIQDGATVFLNSSLNAGDITMLPWYMYGEGAGPKGESTVKPGGGVEVGDTSKILFPKFNSEPATYFKWLDFLINLNERVTSVANPQIGRPDEKGKTATEILSVVQEGNIKFNYQSKTTKEEFVALISTLYDLYYQYMPFDKIITWKGQQVPIPRPALKRNYSFSLTSSTETANKLIERKESEDLFQLSMNNPLANPMTAWEDLLRAYGKTDTKNYIAPGAMQLFMTIKQNPELQQVVQQYLTTKAQVANAVTGGVATAQKGNPGEPPAADKFKKIPGPMSTGGNA